MDSLEDIIHMLNVINRNNARILKSIKYKTKQPHQINAVTDDEQQHNDTRMQSKIDLVSKRRDMVLKAFAPLNSPHLVNLIYDQNYTLELLNDRKHITNFEHIMLSVVCALNYEITTLSKILNLNTKSVRESIARKHMSSSGSYLEILNWLQRCPNCGCILKDVIDTILAMREDPQVEKKLSELNIDTEPLKLNTYQAEILELKQKIKKLENS